MPERYAPARAVVVPVGESWEVGDGVVELEGGIDLFIDESDVAAAALVRARGR